MVFRVAYGLSRDPGGFEDPLLLVNSIGFGVNLPSGSVHYQKSVFAVKGHTVLTGLGPAPNAEGVFPDHAELGISPQNLLGIGCFHGVVRVTELSSDGN